MSKVGWRSVIDECEVLLEAERGEEIPWWYEALAPADEEVAWWARLAQWMEAVCNWDPEYRKKVEAYEATLP